jgi:alanyl-tRNA synthetase
MVQFKDYFLQKSVPMSDAATTVQRCLRVGGKHNDLENVGFTARFVRTKRTMNHKHTQTSYFF